MSLQNQKPEEGKELVNPAPSQQEGQEKDELAEDNLDKVNGGLMWQPSPTSGNGQYSKPIPWTPKP